MPLDCRRGGAVGGRGARERRRARPRDGASRGEPGGRARGRAARQRTAGDDPPGGGTVRLRRVARARVVSRGRRTGRAARACAARMRVAGGSGRYRLGDVPGIVERQRSRRDPDPGGAERRSGGSPCGLYAWGAPARSSFSRARTASIVSSRPTPSCTHAAAAAPSRSRRRLAVRGPRRIRTHSCASPPTVPGRGPERSGTRLPRIPRPT